MEILFFFVDQTEHALLEQIPYLFVSEIQNFLFLLRILLVGEIEVVADGLRLVFGEVHQKGLVVPFLQILSIEQLFSDLLRILRLLRLSFLVLLFLLLLFAKLFLLFFLLLFELHLELLRQSLVFPLRLHLLLFNRPLLFLLFLLFF